MDIDQIIEVDENNVLLNEMRNLIDPTSFNVVKQYYYISSYIKQILIVNTYKNLYKVAYICLDENHFPGEKSMFIFKTCLNEGIIKFAIPNIKQIDSEHHKYYTSFDNFKDDQLCWVILLPPFYITYIDPLRKYK